MDPKEALKKAYGIAKRDLRACYTDEGILAGKIRFDDYWARDSFFASLGSIALKDYAVVKKNLELFLRYQKGNGQLPRRIDRHYVGIKYLGLRIRRENLRPRYTTSLMYCYSVDQNSLFIISLLDYVGQTKDVLFLKQIYGKAKKAIEWNFSNDKGRDLLIEEGYFANWEDTIFWRGKLLYTNVLHCKAMSDFAELARMIGNSQDHMIYKLMAEKVKEKINRHYWHDNHYLKSVIRKRKYKRYFCIDANLLAVLFGIADRERAEKIVEHVKGLGLDMEMPLRSTWPRYPLWKISPTRLLLFSSGYHNAFGWLWVSCLYALALQKIGKEKEALGYLERVASKINQYEGVYEVYAKGRPVRNPFVRSDFPFAWSAGMVVYACDCIKV